MTDVKKLITEHLDIWLTAETEKKSGRGRSSGTKGSIYGIRKIRQLIMDLAIQGKLVKANPTDSNVEVLIDNIKNHKRTFLADNKKIKEIVSRKIDFNDLPFLIPTHWAWVRFGEVTINRDAERIPLSTTVREQRKGSFDYYGASGIIDYVDDYLFDKTLLLIGEDGANLLSRSTPIAFFAAGKYWVNNHAHVIDGYSEDFLNYLKLFINAIDLSPYVTGTAQPKMNQAKMNDILVALPPLEEQKRIVSKVDELMQLCDQLEEQQSLSSEAHDQLVDTLLNVLTNSSDPDEFQQNWQRISENFDLLFTTEYSIEQLKQTILQLAVMGKLVKQDPNDEDVNFLLKRIEINKNERVKSKEIQKPKVISVEQSLKFDIPQNWKKVLLNDIAFVTKLAGFEYTKYMKLADSGEVPVIRAQNVKPFELNENSLKYIDLETSQLLQRCALDRKSLLMTFIGAGIGDVCVFNKEQRYHLAPNVAKIEPFADTNINYLLIFLNGIWGKDEIFKSLKATAQPSISMATIREIWLPLPPLTEQNRIVEKVNELFSIIDKLQTLQGKLQKTKLHLADTLVTNALSDSNDNSKFEVADNIIQFEKPIEIVKQSKQKSADQIDLFADDSVEDDIKLLSLAAEITFQLHTEPTFGHLKLQKLIYLCQQLKHMDLAADFKQHAAGPYDPVMARYLDKEFKNREWFSYAPKRDLKYKPLTRCNDHRTVFNNYFAKDMPEIYDLIGLFRTSKSDHIEIVATLFACWLRLLENKQSITEELLLKDFYAWSEEKNRFSKAEVLNGYKWMKQNLVVPL